VYKFRGIRNDVFEGLVNRHDSEYGIFADIGVSMFLIAESVDIKKGKQLDVLGRSELSE
jgi:hypothetical protein